MKRRQRGHLMIELGISAGVLVTALAGAFQYGYIFYSYNQLVTAVGNGARYAAQRPYRSATPEDIEKGRLAIRNMVAYGNPHPSGDERPVAPGLKPENVKIEWVMSDDGAPVAVDIAITGFEVNAVFGSMKLEGKPAVEFPYFGTYAPQESEK